MSTRQTEIEEDLRAAKADLAFALAQGDGYAEDEAAERIKRLERESIEAGNIPYTGDGA